MSRTSKDLREMAVECRRLASSCNTSEAEEALKSTARELDDSAERQEEISDSGTSTGAQQSGEQ